MKSSRDPAHHLEDLENTCFDTGSSQHCLEEQHPGGHPRSNPLANVCLPAERHRALSRLRNAFLITLDPYLRLAGANPAFTQSQGSPLEDLVGTSIADFLHPDDRQEVVHALYQLDHPPAHPHGIHRLKSPAGTLWVDWEAVATYHPDDQVRTIQIFAYNLTQHKEQQDRLEQHLREAQAMADINRQLNQQLDPDPILESIVHYALTLLPTVERAVLHVYDPDKEVLVPAAFAGWMEAEQITLMMARGSGIAGLAIENRGLINVGDIRFDPRYLPAPGPQPFRSLLVVPIQNDQQVFGTISVQSRSAHAFDADSERVLNQLCFSAALALKNAYQYKRERMRRQLLETFASMDYSQYLNFNLAEVLDHILEHTLSSGLISSANIMLIQGEQAVILDHAGYDYSPGADQMLTNARFSLDLPYFQQMLHTGEPVWSADILNDPLWRVLPGTRELRLRSYAAAPIKVAGHVIGFINADSPSPGAFNHDTAQLLDLIADHTATAIQSARLYESLVQKAEEERRTRDRLTQAEKLAALGRMLSTVVHEINNPLQSIQNCLYILEKESTTLPSASGFFDVALSEVERLSDLVLSLREMHKGGHVTHLAPVELNALLGKVRALVTFQLEQNDVTWDQDEFPAGLLILGDADQLTQVFLNLVLNAIDAMAAQGGTISLELLTRPKEHKVGLRIADTGPGIDPGLANNIFNPFFTTKNEGMGLGLAVCDEIIRNHNGRITLDSRLGTGAAFTVWLDALPDE